MKKDEIIELMVQDVVYNGKGLAKVDGCVVFLPYVIKGEKVNARIVKQSKKYAEAELVEVIEASPSRSEPVCPYFSQCPGCCYQHMAYDEEVSCKQAQLVNFLERSGNISDPVCGKPVVSRDLGYRNKIVLHSYRSKDGVILGYFGKDNRTIMDIDQCSLAMPQLNKKLKELRRKPDFMQKLADRDKLTLRHTAKDGVVYWTGKKAFSDVKWLTELTELGELSVYYRDFFQVNPYTANKLMARVTEHLANIKPARVIDLYCGAGLFALSAARLGVSSVAGIDSGSAAIQAARRNARTLGLNNVRFFEGHVGKDTDKCFSGIDPKSTTVILDPPRSGLDKAALNALIACQPANMIYISCAADTMARDIRLLVNAGYQHCTSQLFDMFPRTVYFETITHLSRRK